MKGKTLTLVFVLAAAGIIATIFVIKGHRRADDRGATPESVNAVVNANNQFAFDFYTEVKDKEDENVFFSPHSISTALAITFEGARAQTAKEIQSIFHFPEDSAIRRSSFAAIYNRLNERHADYLLYAANALWVQKDYRLLPEFVEGVERYYLGKVTGVDFAGSPDRARSAINDWVRKQTDGKIPNMVEGSFDPRTRVVLTDAIYFFTLERWIHTHGGSAIRHRFLLSAAISNSPCDWAERDETKPNQLFLIVEPSEASCGCVTFGPTLQWLEKVHPQLPATFFHLFVGALNRWTGVYDHRDAEERAETLREWAAQEPNADQYEIPDVSGSIPPCMRQEALDAGELAHLKGRINDPLATKLVDAVIALDRVSRQAERPELDDDTGQQLSDCNPSLPCLLAIFEEASPHGRH